MRTRLENQTNGLEASLKSFEFSRIPYLGEHYSFPGLAGEGGGGVSTNKASSSRVLVSRVPV